MIVSNLYRKGGWIIRGRSWIKGYKRFDEEIVLKGHCVYVDNFYSYPKLFTDLYAEDVYCCGTVRGNRKGMPKSSKSCKLKNRDDYKIMKKKPKQIVCFCMERQKVVFYLSNYCDPEDKIPVRHKLKDGTVMEDQCPVTGQLYIRDMFADQLSTSRKSTKCIFFGSWLTFVS